MYRICEPYFIFSAPRVTDNYTGMYCIRTLLHILCPSGYRKLYRYESYQSPTLYSLPLGSQTIIQVCIVYVSPTSYSLPLGSQTIIQVCIVYVSPTSYSLPLGSQTIIQVCIVSEPYFIFSAPRVAENYTGMYRICEPRRRRRKSGFSTMQGHNLPV